MFPPHDRMSTLERRAAAGLASIYGLRMLGMFLILPVFAVYAERLPGGQNHALIGLALGVYGLTQALLHLPFGMFSDRIGRKRVIYFGLVLFALGSFIAAAATDIYVVIIGRTIQGAGAINSVLTALLADLTREEQRTKAMAMVGGTIGLTFALSLVLGPALYHLISIPGIFLVTGVLAVLAIVLVKFIVPDPKQSHVHADAETAPASLLDIVRHRELRRLNFGIFSLHAVQMAMFVVVPFALREIGGLDANHHWQVYLPVLAISVLFMMPLILYSEKKAKTKPVFVSAVALMLLAEVAFVPALQHFWGFVTVLTFYFIAFNVLEASLPSLVSKIAPARAKGTAMGVYNTAQALGLFAGGAMGGVLSNYYGAAAVFEVGAVLIALWLYLAAGMKSPPAVKNLMFHITALSAAEALQLEKQLNGVPGVTEATIIPGENTAYIKVDRRHVDEAALRALLPIAS